MMQYYKKAIFIFLYLLGVSTNLSAQIKPAYWGLALNKGIGFEWNSVNFNQVINSGNRKLNYSPGGGLGLRLGIGKYITERLSTEVYGGYQQVLAFSYENQNGDSNKSYATFGYIAVGGSASFTILRFEKSAFEQIQLVGGGYWHSPNNIKEKENDRLMNYVSYKPSLGWLAGVKGIFNISQSSNTSFTGTIGYNDVSYRSDISMTGDYKKISGAGIFLESGIRKLF